MMRHMLWERIADLSLEIDDYVLEPLAQKTSGGWTRLTTVVRLRGGGVEGVGEDVTYEASDQLALQRAGPVHALHGRRTLAEFSARLDSIELFETRPTRGTNRLYRRWAFESAALDLALRQRGVSLASALDRTPRPVAFVVSLGLGARPTTAPLERVLALYPDARFKVDLSEAWTEATVARLAAYGDRVPTVDFKGQYRGSFEGPRANADQYRWVAERMPHAWLEDPASDGPAWDALAPFVERVTWDAILHSVADIVALPIEPRCVNIKPSRVGFLSELLRTYEYCAARGIAMYGGGQFELGPGRAQIQQLASLFHADAPNDVAPIGFNAAELRSELATSPLSGVHGFGDR